MKLCIDCKWYEAEEVTANKFIYLRTPSSCHHPSYINPVDGSKFVIPCEIARGFKSDGPDCCGWDGKLWGAKE